MIQFLHRLSLTLLVFLRKMEDDFKNLKTLIEVLTHSGTSILDEDTFRKVKKICKSSEENIGHVYSLVLVQLKKNNSQIRLASLQIVRELFKRSGLFREYVLNDLHIIFELTTEINSSKKLPPPKSASESLRTLAISTLNEWVTEFGETYKKLKIAYIYFAKCKNVNFELLHVENSSEQIVEREQQRLLRLVNNEKLSKVMEEFSSHKPEIEMTITTLSNCLSLLLPPIEEFFIPEQNLQKINSLQTSDSNSNAVNSNITDKDNIDNEENCENELLDSSNNLRTFGVPLNYNLTLELKFEEKFNVTRTEENNSVFENAKDCVRLINIRYLPMVKKWVKIYSKCCNRLSNDFKEILDLKEKLENILKKHESIICIDSSDIFVDENSSDDDNDFEEVVKEGYEESVEFPEELKMEYLQSKPGLADTSIRTQASQSVLKVEGTPSVLNEPSTSGESSSTSQTVDRKKRLLSIAPKLPYDIDLYHWEDENLSTPTLISSKIDVDKFWGSAESDDIHVIPNPDGVAALRTRVIEYSGTFEPVKWACRAHLPSGKLCPRKDRYKCPFHGKIVARDEMGNIQNKSGEEILDKTVNGSSSTVVTELQDLEFLNDLQAATGVDLKIPNRKRKKQKSHNNLTHKKMKTTAAALRLLESKKLPGLVDVVKRENNAYTRLKKKIFNRSSLRRVTSVLNKLDRKRYQDKYGTRGDLKNTVEGCQTAQPLCYKIRSKQHVWLVLFYVKQYETALSRFVNFILMNSNCNNSTSCMCKVM